MHVCSSAASVNPTTDPRGAPRTLEHHSGEIGPPCHCQPMSAVRELKYYLNAPESSSVFQLKVTAGETWLSLTRTPPAPPPKPART